MRQKILKNRFSFPYYKWNNRSGVVRNRNGEQVGKLDFMVDEISNTIYLSYVLVKPNFQGRGLGRRFVESLVNFAKSNGIQEIELYACPIGNAKLEKEKLKAFYRTCGFRVIKGSNGKDDMKIILKGDK